MKKKKGVVTVRNWVYCGDGNQYKAFYGWVRFEKAEDLLGFRPGSGQANFIITVGVEYPVLISGCEFVAFEHCDELTGRSKDIFWVD